jgi:TRAP-type mannitol/chloroaromatic compound transport system permease large subunit
MKTAIVIAIIVGATCFDMVLFGGHRVAAVMQWVQMTLNGLSDWIHSFG